MHSRKKKTPAINHGNRRPTVSNTYNERFCTAIRKFFQHFGYVELFDSFTKKQRALIIQLVEAVPHIRAEKGKVPRQYLKNIQTEILNFMKTHYFDEAVELTFWELLLYCTPAMFLINKNIDCFLEEQKKQIQAMIDIYEKGDIINRGVDAVLGKIMLLLSEYSKINFRTYGFSHDWETKPLRYIIEITSLDNPSVYFTHQNVRRQAYLILTGRTHLYDNSYVICRTRKLFPHNQSDKELPIYIQSHALQRFKERADIINPKERNMIMYLALEATQRIVKFKGNNLIACDIIDTAGITLTTNAPKIGSEDIVPIGYFTTLVKDSRLYILTFLPLAGSNTPEGDKLQDILKITVDDIKYLGMDKLSFFFKIDFDRIPVLKNALVQAGIWRTVEFLIKKIGNAQDLNEKTTLFVKDFFEKQLEQMNKLTMNNE
ncbi:MAG: hypothetical protein LBT50_03515 [Prevotellaceae bacterium]|jgi:hypothetical protein|nr:hypothetical protein [Prevotellaceae bacterium]